MIGFLSSPGRCDWNPGMAFITFSTVAFCWPAEWSDIFTTAGARTAFESCYFEI